MSRLAIVDLDRCKPKKCNSECKRICPVNRNGMECVTINTHASISEDMCIGCNMCIKKCPFNAIKIINVPKNIDKDTIHRYGENGFKLHRLPIPTEGYVLGIIGCNGIGKTTAINILSGQILPNFNKDIFDLDNVIKYFRGTELQKYFQKLSTMKIVIKPQHIDKIKTNNAVTLQKIIGNKDITDIVNKLDLENVLDRDINKLSGGELQKVAIALTCIKEADVYIFDEPSSYLDIKQRMIVANLIRDLAKDNKYVIVIEHDLSVLDYVSDKICCVYGEPGVYGIFTTSFGLGTGINMYLDGYIPNENMRFRTEAITFNISEQLEYDQSLEIIKYDDTDIALDTFKLHIEKGFFKRSEITVLLGKNGTGKTTMIKHLRNTLKQTISYKPQKIQPKYDGTVKQLYQERIPNIFEDSTFMKSVLEPLGVLNYFDKTVKYLSGGEAQRVAIGLVLGKNVDIYLIDEPSAHLDCEERLIVAKIIKRFVLNNNKTAFIVEHDMIMATYMADKMILFDGEQGISCVAHSPTSTKNAMNTFLKQLDVTVRRDPNNFRPRINKKDSVMDKEQKKDGKYFV